MKVGIIGLGYVGLPLAVAFAEEGHDVVGLDVDRRTVEGLAAGRSRIEDVPDERIAAIGDRLVATTDPAPACGVRRRSDLRADTARQSARA